MDLSFSESECGINEEEKTGKLVKAALELYDVVPQVSIKGNEAELLSGKPIPKAKIGATKRGHAPHKAYYIIQSNVREVLLPQPLPSPPRALNSRSVIKRRKNYSLQARDIAVVTRGRQLN
ncbi:hypothetical protein RRG08_039798 [Elysia crispata]|uniref:Uncharacterized protein n=1 Tax=Elysia crispata TaxID=231223 RepID=A0AAE1ARW4_9GAST|nr:hypothetical protein RRG08_039798 [Elysia crispata]